MVDFLFALAGLFLVLPFFTGYVASEYDRSFWKWFGLGCVTHLIAPIVLFVLIRRDEREAALRTTGLRLIAGGLTEDAPAPRARLVVEPLRAVP